jgi:hypothetical protein
MTFFHDLYQSPALPVAPNGALDRWQRGADELFPSIVARSPLRLWHPGDAIPRAEKRLLIGVATWSAHDMKLLDAVAAALQAPHPPLTVDVFNVADCPTADSFKEYIPGIDGIYQTPIVGLWSDGQLVEKATGFAGRELIAKAAICEELAQRNAAGGP